MEEDSFPRFEVVQGDGDNPEHSCPPFLRECEPGDQEPESDADAAVHGVRDGLTACVDLACDRTPAVLPEHPQREFSVEERAAIAEGDCFLDGANLGKTSQLELLAADLVEHLVEIPGDYFDPDDEAMLLDGGCLAQNDGGFSLVFRPRFSVHGVTTIPERVPPVDLPDVAFLWRSASVTVSFQRKAGQDTADSKIQQAPHYQADITLTRIGCS